MREFSKHELEFLRWLLTDYLLEYTGHGKDLAMLDLARKILTNIQEEIKKLEQYFKETKDGK